jgi:hypothetical protein
LATTDDRSGNTPTNRGGVVAIQVIQEFTVVDHGTDNYDVIKERIGVDHPGLICHTAGFDDQSGVFRIVDTWETKDDAERFYNDTFGPQLQEMLEAVPSATPRPASSCTSSTT